MKNFNLRVFSSLIMILVLTGVHLSFSDKQKFILISVLTIVLSWEYYKLVFYKPSQLLLRWFFIFLSFLSYLFVCFFCKDIPFLIFMFLILIFMLINLAFVSCFWLFVIFNKFCRRKNVQNQDVIILDTDAPKKDKNIVKSVFFILIGLLYIFSPALFLYAYYISPLYILIYLCIVFSGDIFAYLGGSLLGGKKWVPLISPGKTWSGLTSGLLVSGFICLLCFYLKGYKNLPVYFLFGFFIFFIAQTGDLFISFLKRKAEVKDTGILLPGHGGLLDRLDGFLIALPFYVGVIYIVKSFPFDLFK